MPPLNADLKIKENIERTSTNENGNGVTEKEELLLGQFLANPSNGEEVVVTGLAGQFPNSDNVYHFRDNLFGKVDMVSGDTRRWEHTHPEIPTRSGKINRIQKFDAGFFGVHHRQANTMDPLMRAFLESAVECIMDAGLNPSDLEGTNCGVFVGACFSESEKIWFYEDLVQKSYAITGCQRSVIANRLSYYLKLSGPSVICDTACSSSLYALEQAYRAIRCGQIDAAIVGGTNVCLHPFVSLQFARLGVLSMDGKCKSFDAEGNGYARSEAICSVFLQKAKNANRIYCQVIHAKTNCDGYKEQGITYPSGDMQRRLLTKFYEECDVNPANLSFLEAHGTGTKVGDPEECAAIDEVFCKERKRPLLVGSVKSSIGHSEPSSGLCSLTKAIIAFESGYIPPNMYFNKAREGVKALEEGRLRVVTEKIPFEDDRGLIGINSFGFGGGNCHVLTKWHTKIKENGGFPKDDLPRLICVSGRVKEAITSILDDLINKRLDAELVGLLHNIFRKNIKGHLHRGYSVLSKSGEITRSWNKVNEEVKKLYIGFGGVDNSWHAIGSQLLKIPVFAATVQRIHNLLSKHNININDILLNNKNNALVSNSILGNLAVQIGIIDLLKTIELTPDGVFGQSVGQLACAYFDGALSLEETVLAAVVITNAFKSNSEPAINYVIKVNQKEIKQLPQGVEITGIVSSNEFLISGKPKVMGTYIRNLESRKVETGDMVQLKSSAIEKVKSQLIQQLKKIILKPRTISKKWLTHNQEKTVTAEYLINSLISPYNYSSLTKQIQAQSIVMEVGSGQLTKVMEECFKNKQIETVYLDQQSKQDNVVGLLDALGRLYNYGRKYQISRIYPKVQFPVSRGTPMIAPYVKWNHSQDWFVFHYTPQKSVKTDTRAVTITEKTDEWESLPGHMIDGRNLFPGAGYLFLVWESFARILDSLTTDINVVFENVKFLRASHLTKNGILEFIIMIQRGSGNFELIESGNIVVTGKISVAAEKDYVQLPVPLDALEDNIKMTTKDIYKELRIRGYNYAGEFRSLIECDVDSSKCLIRWNSNWVTFIDNMFQLMILQTDSRFLYVPTGIDKLVIHARPHVVYTKQFGENPAVPAYFYKECNVIKSGGVEIRGLRASSIPRRKARGEPVLEKYTFIPNETELTLKQSIRVNVQLSLENCPGYKVKVVEIIDEVTREDAEPLSPIIYEVLSDLPLIQPNISVFTKKEIKLDNITVEDKKIVSDTDCTLVIATNIFSRVQIIQHGLNALKPNGFMISREDHKFDISKIDTTGIDVVTIHKCDNEKIVVIKKKVEYQPPCIIDVTDQKFNFNWLADLQAAVKKDDNLIVLAQNDPLSGVIGLVNCLRREPGVKNIRCFFIMDLDVPKFDPDHLFYLEEVKKNLAINVFKDGKWGTYRHLRLENINQVESEHCYVNSTVRGDLSSFRWIEGPLTSKTKLPEEKSLVSVYYTSINFRDVMTASGRINADVITMDRTEQECVQGFEYSGKTQDGRRVMGMMVSGACTTLVSADNYLIYDVPDCWTLQEAATVPVVYCTVFFSMVMTARIRRGMSVLIHCGAGGVGQAAISIALYYGCRVYTTVGTPEKREFLKKRFPQMRDRQIGNSRDTSFEHMIFRETEGRGVDVVLNSLAEDKLLASVRCLAHGGKFLEIGKFDLANNNLIKMHLLDKEASFHGIMLDVMFLASPKTKLEMGDMLRRGIRAGAVRPLNAHIFKAEEAEQAFRFMAAGKHMGKVVLQIRKEEQQKLVPPKPVLFKCLPRYLPNEANTYVICGGLGGFGLELADWMILRGVRKLVLTSRNGVKTGYQASRIKIWNTYGTQTVISTADITTRSGCQQLLKEANKLGPVHAIFNLAVVLRDGLLENQTVENFQTSFAPKALATKYLDEVSREMCPDLRDFVIFSSVSCGRGNPGQTNYGMANSVMERICEKRRADGYPAVGIEWGAVGDVGLVAEMQENHTEMEIGGTLQQRITSCMQVLDVFLKQKNAIVSSMVVAEKRAGVGAADNIVDAVANILGLGDLKTVSLHATLAELGMDSITAVEIKQTLEREFDVFLAAQDIRSMTFARLQEIEAERETEESGGKKKERLPGGIELILRLIGDESSCNVPMIRLPSKVKEDTYAPTVILLPGLEGVASILKPLASNLNCHALTMQFCHDNPEDSLVETAEYVLPNVEKNISKEQPFKIVAYSFGATIALEVVSKLEQKGYDGTLILIDGSPKMLYEIMKQQLNIDSEDQFQTGILCALMALYMPYESILKNREKLFRCATYEERMKVAKEAAPKDTPHSEEHQRKVAINAYKKLRGLKKYQPSFTKIKSKVKLFKPKHLSVPNLPEDYYLSEICEQPVEIRVFDGNHISILENVEVADAINIEVGAAPLFVKKSMPEDETDRTNSQEDEVNHNE